LALLQDKMKNINKKVKKEFYEQMIWSRISYHYVQPKFFISIFQFLLEFNQNMKQILFWWLPSNITLHLCPSFYVGQKIGSGHKEVNPIKCPLEKWWYFIWCPATVIHSRKLLAEQGLRSLWSESAILSCRLKLPVLVVVK